MKTLSRRLLVGPVIFAAAALLMSFSSCGKGDGDRSTATPGKKWKFTIVKFEELQQTEDTERGLRLGLRDAGLIEGVDYEITSLNAQGDIPVLLSLFDKVSADNTDLLISLQTTTLNTAIKRVRNTPIVFMVVANPFVITTVGQNDTLHLPYLTGVYTKTTFDRMLEYIRACMPQAKSIGTLFSSRELNATYYKSQLLAAAQKQGLEVKAMDVGSRTDVSPAMHALCGMGVDAICQIEDNLTSASFPVIAQVARQYKLPIFSFVNEQARMGSSVVFAPDYHETARETASMITRLMRGEKAGDIPFRRVNRFHLIVNPDNASSIGLKIPENVIAQADSVIGNPG